MAPLERTGLSLFLLTLGVWSSSSSSSSSSSWLLCSANAASTNHWPTSDGSLFRSRRHASADTRGNGPTRAATHTRRFFGVTPASFAISLKKKPKTQDATSTATSPVAAESTPKQTQLVFPGGGLYFYWQAGVVTYMREAQLLESSEISYSGASAGALAATLTATNVDFEDATRLALLMSEEADVWNRPLGLQGVWGGIIEQWLDELLPPNATDYVARDELSLLVTPVPSFGKDLVSSFSSKQDLIRCNMASVHLPWFLNGEFTTQFRNRPHLDGSFLAREVDYLGGEQGEGESEQKRVLKLDWSRDPIMSAKGLQEFLKLVSPQGIWDILELGRNYARQMDQQGELDLLKDL